MQRADDRSFDDLTIVATVTALCASARSKSIGTSEIGTTIHSFFLEKYLIGYTIVMLATIARVYCPNNEIKRFSYSFEILNISTGKLTFNKNDTQKTTLLLAKPESNQHLSLLKSIELIFI